MSSQNDIVVIISADAEWRAIRKIYPGRDAFSTPFGEWFSVEFPGHSWLATPVVFMHGGWGKVAASASTQYAIDHWQPAYLVNLGTCGGFSGLIKKGEIVLVTHTVIYDIYEQMGDPELHLKHYMTSLDLSWISQPYPLPVRNSVLVSGDRDLFSRDIPELKEKYGAVAGDWESGAVAWVADKNQVKCLILRGVTDLVGDDGGEAYNGNVNFYYENTTAIMRVLIESFPAWLSQMSEPG